MDPRTFHVMEQVVSNIVGGAILAGIGLAQSTHIFAGKKEKGESDYSCVHVLGKEGDG